MSPEVQYAACERCKRRQYVRQMPVAVGKAAYRRVWLCLECYLRANGYPLPPGRAEWGPPIHETPDK